MEKISFFKNKIGIIGLGYVGLPLAVEFSKKFKVVGYDLDITKIRNISKRKNINEIEKKTITDLKILSLQIIKIFSNLVIFLL